MSTRHAQLARLRTRWSAVGAAVAITLGAGGIGLAQAAIEDGEKPVTITVEPERILDTRDNLGLTGAFASETPRDLQVTGDVPVASGGTATVVPDGASAVLVNVTAVNPSGDGFLSLRPAGAAGAPSTSTVNFGPGTVEPNAATVDLSATGAIQIYAFILGAAPSVHVLVDVVGYTIDHNHNDIYYTEDEVDAALTASVPIARHISGNQSESVGTTDEVVRAVTITAPTDGTVIVQSTAGVARGGSGGAGLCSLTTGTVRDQAYNQIYAGADRGMMAGQRAFAVAAGATLTVNLVCDTDANTVSIFDSTMTATFYPGSDVIATGAAAAADATGLDER